MRYVLAAFLLLMLALPVTGWAETADISPAAANPRASTEQNNAAWAELEAQKRALEGDYEGAVQAEQQADVNRRAVERNEALARSNGAKR